jgi:hypothetical protein
VVGFRTGLNNFFNKLVNSADLHLLYNPIRHVSISPESSFIFQVHNVVESSHLFELHTYYINHR